ncbi:hypothetical protein [Egbenema bharatensis]|uniref:hypothetical protein n=1 Tax=Egbenema bharatensis TaxID=3463334 RepID=UPI003A8ADB0B
MKKHIALAILSTLTFGSMTASVTSDVRAVTTRPEQIESTITTTTVAPIEEMEASLDESASEELMAQGYYCEYYTNGYYITTCCIDSYGNWACVTQ